MKTGTPSTSRTNRRRRLGRVALALACVGVGVGVVLYLLGVALRAVAPHLPMIAVLTAIAVIVLCGGTSANRRG
ncbi:hypothetical protein ACFFX1_10720 [Dactylosporangium sucinum]|uniref:Uncharacterized protein n=1 Tax=Dactylosporangium sucinum TaxID=1424081 RepID=A0A917TGY2_9ACTN|nr:hypothetical protein [Dactylosporangium sucinum]GGM23085.1 hypothetical protein GCM10007977_025390 [Dactylosporangium sucinum]